MWPVYSEEEHRAALAEWESSSPWCDPPGSGDFSEGSDQWEERYRRRCHDEEAFAAADCVVAEQRHRDHPLPVLLLVGAGGNGRAGLRVGRRLLSDGYRVEVALFPLPRPEDNPDRYPSPGRDLLALWQEDASPESRELLRGFLASGGEVTRSSFADDVLPPYLVVDAICGRGLDGRLRGVATGWASWFVDRPPVVAIDAPTGMDPDSGATVAVAEEATPAAGGFTAKNTVVVGGLRAVHLLREECGRLVFVRGGLHRLLEKEWERRTTVAACSDAGHTGGEQIDAEQLDGIEPGQGAAQGPDQEPEQSPIHHMSARQRTGFLAQNPLPEMDFPASTTYLDSSAASAPRGDETDSWRPQLLGSLCGVTADRVLVEWMRAVITPTTGGVMTIGVAGSPQRRPGAPELVASGVASWSTLYTASSPPSPSARSIPSAASGGVSWSLVTDSFAADRVSRDFPEVEVVTSADSGPAPCPCWVLCAGDAAVDLSRVPTLILTRDALRDWIDGQQRPPEPVAGQRIIMVVDEETARAVLRAWYPEWASERGSPGAGTPVDLAEAVAGCTGYEVVLLGSPCVWVNGLDTAIIRNGVSAGTHSWVNSAEVLAGAVAALCSVSPQAPRLFLPVVAFARTMMVVARSDPPVPLTARNMVGLLPVVLRDVSIAVHDALPWWR